MLAFTPSSLNRGYSASPLPLSDVRLNALLQGEVSIETRAHTAWGAAVTAQIYLPLSRETVWEKITDYSNWVKFFPDMNQSHILSSASLRTAQGTAVEVKRLYQKASKTFLFLSAQVEVYLRVFETIHQQIEFRLESGNFADFLADLRLKECADGTLATYYVEATPTFPVPSIFIQQAIHFDLPSNLRQMRQVICR